MTTSEPDYHVPSPAVAYEVAREILNQLIGISSTRLRQEEDKGNSDQVFIADGQRMLTRWTQRRQTLEPEDTDAVRAVLDEDGATLRSLLSGTNVTRPPAAHSALRPEILDAVLHSQIVPMLNGARAPDQPTVVVLSAQAGAGKTHITRLLERQFAESGGAVAVDVDAMKPFHPEFGSWVAAHGVRAWDLVIPEARHWFERSLDYLAERRVNVIAEHGLRSPEVIDSLLQRFQAAGYRIEVALLATPRPLSRLGILERYETGYEWTGLGRGVSGTEHDWRYDNLLKVADLVENDPRVANVCVYRRGSARPLYRSGTEQPPDHVGARDALQAERDRPWTLAESESFLRRYGSLQARMADEWQQPLREAREAARPLLHPDAGRGPARDAGATG